MDASLIAQGPIEGVEQGVQLGCLGENVRGHADALRAAGNANPAGGALGKHAFQVPLDRLETDQPRVTRISSVEAGGRGRVELDAKAGGLLLPATAAAGMFLVGQQHLVAGFQVKTVADRAMPRR